MVVVSFLLFLLLFTLIGAAAALKSRGSSSDYLLADSSVPAWLAALSAVATNNSGYMFVGQIGYTYLHGLESIWMMVGWIFGDFLMSRWVHGRLRQETEKNGALGYVSVLGTWGGVNRVRFRRLASLVTVAFLGTYAAAQLNAGGKALFVLFGWSYSTGAILGACIICVYCFSGGIRASIWTDAAQSFVMLVAMGTMALAAFSKVGGWSPVLTGLNAVDEGYLSLWPSSSAGILGISLLFVAGWLFAGFGVIGQPHIMVRFMALEDAKQIQRARAFYYAWYITFFTLTILAGLLARLLIPEVNSFDAELALPTLAQSLLPQVFVGLVLAGLFAATMSTADSQVLSCTASLSNNCFGDRTLTYTGNKVVTLLVTVIALGVALMGNQSVFSLVLISWSGLGAAFGPLLFVLARGGHVSDRRAVTMVLVGLTVVVLWRVLGWNTVCYEILPGMVAGSLTYFLWPSRKSAPSKEELSPPVAD